MGLPARWWPFLLLTMPASPAHATEQIANLLTTNYPPYSAEALPQGGAFTAAVREALALNGWGIKLRFVPWARVPTEIRSGRVDAVLVCWPREIREFGLLSSTPIYASRLGFFVRRSEAASTEVTLARLRGVVVGTVRSYGYPDQLAAAGVVREDAAADATNLRKLAAGRFRHVVLEQAVGNYLLGTTELAALRPQLSWKGPAFATVPLSVGVVPGQGQSASLLAALNQGLQTLHKNGRLHQLGATYAIAVAGGN